ncbi:Sds3-like-domain-containing protein [Umbelopsis sp. PMI_123]|nr:Sds3-like-domain-containing protein [Umbelopsis sp. PMI_123]
MQLQCVTMTAPIEEERPRTAIDDKYLKANAEHSPVRHSSLPDEATLTPQSLSPHNSTVGLPQSSFNDNGELSNTQSRHEAALRSPSVEPSPGQGYENRRHNSTKNGETAVKHKLDASNQQSSDFEYSKKQRVDETEDIEATQTEAYEELRKTAYIALRSIEQDFAKLRERLYHERIAELEKEVTAISTGKHPDYSLAISEIDRRRNKQMEQVSEWRRHKNNDIHRQMQSSVRSAHVNFQAKRAELRRSVMANIMSQKQKLTDEMLLFDNAVSSLPSESTLKQHRERTLQDSKETLGISTTVGFPISMKPTGYDEAETESDVRKIQQTEANEKSKISYIT